MGKRETRIKELEESLKLKQEEISKLKAEIREINPNTLSVLCNNQPINMILIHQNGEIKTHGTRQGKAWFHIRMLSQHLFFNRFPDNAHSWWNDEGYTARYDNDYSIKICNMTYEQKKLCAQFCDEVIPIYNKYVQLANSELLTSNQFTNERKK